MRIMTPDKDLAQCLRGDRGAQVDRRQRKVTTRRPFARPAASPDSVPDFLALTETPPRDPRTAGFGDKGASLLIGAYAHLEAIPDVPSRWTVRPRGARQLAATLAAQREEALLYRRLATLVDTCRSPNRWTSSASGGCHAPVSRPGAMRSGRPLADDAETLERRVPRRRRAASAPPPPPPTRAESTCRPGRWTGRGSASAPTPSPSVTLLPDPERSTELPPLIASSNVQ